MCTRVHIYVLCTCCYRCSHAVSVVYMLIIVVNVGDVCNVHDISVISLHVYIYIHTLIYIYIYIYMCVHVCIYTCCLHVVIVVYIL